MYIPSEIQIKNSKLAHFMEKMGFNNYHELHQWSVTQPEFWREVWNFVDLVGEPGSKTLMGDGTILGSTWFPEGKLSYAENIFAKMPELAMVYWIENKVKKVVTKNELLGQVSKLTQFFEHVGLQQNDRVAAVLSNRPEAISCLLATSMQGAIWSSCSPDFGVQGIVDRFGQIEPRILITAPTYVYNGKTISIMDKIHQLADLLPSVEVILLIDDGGVQPQPQHKKIKLWSQLLHSHKEKPLVFTKYPFNHPLYILYSSGTTGTPKCIVHSAGGSLLQHMKEHQLHCDIHVDDKVFYFTTLGWMMWNWLVSASASGATLLLYDGSPFFPKGTILFDYAMIAEMTHFGTSAKYIDALKKINLMPHKTHDLSPLRMVLSTGSPLAPESFDYVDQAIKQNVQIASISGGTDIVSCFVLGCPILPVHRGEIQVAGLGMDVDVFDDEGKTCVGEKGELVCKSPFPARPLYFWNDQDQVKFKAAYFERFPPYWAHGDYVECTKNKGYIIYGRSDAVLNPGGVRIGTAEIYRQVEQIDEVLESIAVGQNWNYDVRVILFVKLRPGIKLTDSLVDGIKKIIKDNASPRHVPAKIIAVEDIPRTKSGKIVELAVRSVIHGEQVKNIEALANPQALEYFKNLAELS